MKYTFLLIFNILCFIFVKGQSTSLCDLVQIDSVYYKNGLPYTGEVFLKCKSEEVCLLGKMQNGHPDGLWYQYQKNEILEFIIGYSNKKITSVFSFGNRTFDRLNSLYLLNEPSNSDTITYFIFYKNEDLEGQNFQQNNEGIWEVPISNKNLKKKIQERNGETIYPYFIRDKKGNKISVDYGTIVKKKMDFPNSEDG